MSADAQRVEDARSVSFTPVVPYATRARIAREVTHTDRCQYIIWGSGFVCDCGAVETEAARRLAAHGTWCKRPEPDHSRWLLRAALDQLHEDAERSLHDAELLAYIQRLERDRSLIKRGARSKGGTHYWTGRNWKAAA